MNKTLDNIIKAFGISFSFTSLLVNRDRSVTLVHPDITARAAANADTASRVLSTSSAPGRNRSINSLGMLSKDLYNNID